MSSVILVSGGLAGPGDGDAPLASVELLRADGWRLCALPDLPAPRFSHSQTGGAACGGGGGDTGTSCVEFSGEWKTTHTWDQAGATTTSTSLLIPDLCLVTGQT